MLRNIVGLLMMIIAFHSCGPNTEAEAPVETEQEVTESPEEQTTAAIQLADDTLAYQVENGVIQLTWDLLANIDFEEKYNEEIDQQVPYPLFHPTIKSIDGKKVTIEGFVLPLDETGDESIVILSAFPYSQCFFCGNAGPESVLDIQMKDQKKGSSFSMDEKTRFVGKLRLNDSDLYYLNYILEEAEIAGD